MTKKTLFLMTALALSLSSCGSKMEFDKSTGNLDQWSGVNQGQNGDYFFPLEKTSESFKQDVFGKNTIKLDFQVIDANGTPVTNITKDSITVKEEGIDVTGFTLDSVMSNGGKTADIVFVIDTTLSMDPYIDQVKLKVSKFVTDLASTNIKGNLCLVAFGDTVRQKCTKFVEDNPGTAVNENTQAFLDSLNRINVYGGDDDPENQLEALTSAATDTPWHAGAQRVAILVTDEEFHYAPDHLGFALTAPTYQAAYDTLLRSQMTTFAVAPSKPGYDSKFGALAPLPIATGGKWYKIDDILSGKLNMSEVFNSIVDRLRVTYTLTYAVDDIPGLNPTMPLKDRVFVITLKDTTVLATVTMLSQSSSMPDGQPNYRTSFQLSASDPDPMTIEVMVDSKPVSTGFSLQGDQLVFGAAPAAGSEISVEYSHLDLRNNFKLAPMLLVSTEPVSSVSVTVNGYALTTDDFAFRQVEDDKYIIELKETLFSSIADPLSIRASGGLTVKVTPH